MVNPTGPCPAKPFPNTTLPTKPFTSPAETSSSSRSPRSGAVLIDVHRIVIGSLAGNPFPDATPEFFQSIADSNGLGLDHPITVEAPLSHIHKEELLASNLGLPLHLTLTCSNPQLGSDPRLGSDNPIIHCSECNKCRERHEAYIDAGVQDDTRYASPLGETK